MDSDLTRAVLENNVGFLKMLPETTGWYRFQQPLTGNTLLHFAILHRKKEVFDYLLTIADFPLKRENNEKETALDFCFGGYSSSSSDEYFACELIKRGAAEDYGYLPDGVTLLNAAIVRNFSKMFELLMEMGCDVNGQNSSGATPLWMSICRHYPREDPDELVTTLLYHGAHITSGRRRLEGYNPFEYVVMFQSNHLQEIFYNLMVDEYTSMNIQLEILLFLAIKKSPLFLGTLKHTKKITVNCQTVKYYRYLFLIDVDDLDILIKTHPDAIREVFFKATGPSKLTAVYNFNETKSLENLNYLLESDLRDDTIHFLVNLDNDLVLLIRSKCDESTALGYVCFLLSYGVKLTYDHLMAFYERYGFGELLGTILHVETQPEIHDLLQYRELQDARSLLLFDVHVDLQKILQRAKRFWFKNPRYFLHYFADAKLRALCGRSRSVSKIAKQPDVPLLVELARNTFRKFFVETFSIKNASEFRSLVDKLPVASGHKRIITLEAKLY